MNFPHNAIAIAIQNGNESLILNMNVILKTNMTVIDISDTDAMKNTVHNYDFLIGHDIDISMTDTAANGNVNGTDNDIFSILIFYVAFCHDHDLAIAPWDHGVNLSEILIFVSFGHNLNCIVHV